MECNMLKTRSLLLTFILLMAGGTANAQRSETAAAEATPMAGCGPSSTINDLFTAFGSTGKMPAELGKWLNNEKIQSIPPFQVFDNVYYVGICWVSAWLLKTSDGLVLIDTLYEPYTGRLLENIKKLGFDSADIKLVLVTHGHFDHAGGISRLKALTHARIAMTHEGWIEARQNAQESQGKPGAWTMPSADGIELKDGEILTVGDTRIQAFSTPGHTWGTASYVFDVKDGNQTYKAITVGGLGLNAIDGPQQVEAYIRSIDRIKKMVSDPRHPIRVHLTSHPFSNGMIEAAARLKERQPGQPHPMDDAAGIIKQLDQLRLGASARLKVEQAKTAE